MRYRVGEMAELFGLTTEGIRYLEKRGFIRSQRENNGYRTYAKTEKSQLRHIRSLCSMGFSLEEAERMISETPRDEILSALDAKLNDLSKKAQELARMQRMLAEHRDIINHMLVRTGEFSLTRCAEMIFFPTNINATDERTRAAEKAWIAAMPSVMMCALYGEEDEIKGLAATAADADELSLPRLDGMIRIPSQLCVHSVLEAPIYARPDLHQLFEWAAGQGLNPGGRTCCLMRLTFKGTDAQRWTIHEVYQPVENG